MKKIIYILVVISLFSCLREEEPIKPVEKGTKKIGGVDINNNGDYSNQIYYDIDINEVVRTIDRDIWDLGFESSPSGFTVITNTSCNIVVSKTGETDFANVTNLGNLTLNYKWDDASGNPDSLALKDWIISGVPTNEVFVLNRGERADLSARGFKKIKIISVTPTEFVIEYANINGSDFQRKTITKNQNKNFTSFSFDQGGKIVEVEPDKTDWDLVLTQYTATFYELVPQLNYSVSGVLINTKLVKGVKVFDKEFSTISISDVGVYTFSDSANVIGFDWKLFDFDGITYSIVPGQNYLLQSKTGRYYKLRFIDFYSSLGIKGSPRFEFEELI
jgi:hypothetical protein